MGTPLRRPNTNVSHVQRADCATAACVGRSSWFSTMIMELASSAGGFAAVAIPATAWRTALNGLRIESRFLRNAFHGNRMPHQIGRRSESDASCSVKPVMGTQVLLVFRQKGRCLAHNPCRPQQVQHGSFGLCPAMSKICSASCAGRATSSRSSSASFTRRRIEHVKRRDVKVRSFC